MPTYDYRCDVCNYSFEEFHGMQESPEYSCPHCSSPVSRVISGGAGIIFKGSGFYVTDNKGSSSKPVAESAEKGNGNTTGSTQEGSSPAAATSGKPAAEKKTADTAS